MQIFGKFFDYLIFLKHLGSIAYMDIDKITEKSFSDLVLKLLKNVEIYNKEIKNYWADFPKEIKNVTESSDNESINKPFTIANTLFYDKEPVCSVRFLDKIWIKQKFKKEFMKRLKDNPNRVLPIPLYVRNSILAEMQKLHTWHVTHVYKYTCKNNNETEIL